MHCATTYKADCNATCAAAYFAEWSHWSLSDRVMHCISSENEISALCHRDRFLSVAKFLYNLLYTVCHLNCVAFFHLKKLLYIIKKVVNANQFYFLLRTEMESLQCNYLVMVEFVCRYDIWSFITQRNWVLKKLHYRQNVAIIVYNLFYSSLEWKYSMHCLVFHLSNGQRGIDYPQSAQWTCFYKETESSTWLFTQHLIYDHWRSTINCAGRPEPHKYRKVM